MTRASNILHANVKVLLGFTALRIHCNQQALVLAIHLRKEFIMAKGNNAQGKDKKKAKAKAPAKAATKTVAKAPAKKAAAKK